MNSYRVIKYLVSDNVGMSAKAIIGQYIDNTHNTNFNHPWDLGDLERCILATESLDLNNVKHMKIISRQWHNISNKWFELRTTFKSNKNECYSILRECIK